MANLVSSSSSPSSRSCELVTNPAHRRQIAHATSNNNKKNNNNGKGNPQMAPAKRICGNQIKVAPQQQESVVEGIKIKLAPLLVANFVIICCQLPLPVYAFVCVCVCALWHVYIDDKTSDSTNNSHTSTRATVTRIGSWSWSRT